MSSAFMTLYTGLSREGPGTPEDVAWAAEVLDVAETEIATWRVCRSETGYLLSVVCPT